jgi:1-deoxy-D-xylulose-5-phosphate synthase
MAPSNEKELRQMIYNAIECYSGPVFVRYPRGKTTGVPKNEPFSQIPCGVPKIIKKGKEIVLLGLGDFFTLAQQTADILCEKGFKPTLVDPRFVKPLDAAFYTSLAEKHRLMVTFENNSLAGGYGSGVTELLHTLDLKKKADILPIGLPDTFITHGERATLLKIMQLDAPSVAERIVSRLGAYSPTDKKRRVAAKR